MEIAIAIISLVVSLFTLWVTYLHKGTVKMTRPTIVIFAHEGMRVGEPKVFLRTLLRSTSKQGEIIESLFLKVTNNKITQTFSVWAYGDNGVVRGSGLYVGEQGVEVYHHFIISKSFNDYKFLPGHYKLEIVAIIKEKKKKLYELELYLPDDMLETLNNGVLGIYFDWHPEENKYTPSIEKATPGKYARLLS